jgi:hypothetical protein
MVASKRFAWHAGQTCVVSAPTTTLSSFGAVGAGSCNSSIVYVSASAETTATEDRSGVGSAFRSIRDQAGRGHLIAFLNVHSRTPWVERPACRISLESMRMI